MLFCFFCLVPRFEFGRHRVNGFCVFSLEAIFRMGHDVPIFSNLFQVSAEDVPFASLVAESSDP